VVIPDRKRLFLLWGGLIGRKEEEDLGGTGISLLYSATSSSVFLLPACQRLALPLPNATEKHEASELEAGKKAASSAVAKLSQTPRVSLRNKNSADAETPSKGGEESSQ
jgi:hypothetical protein